MRRFVYAVLALIAGLSAFWLFQHTYGQTPERSLWLVWGLPFVLTVATTVFTAKAAGASGRSIWSTARGIAWFILGTASLAGVILILIMMVQPSSSVDGLALAMGLAAVAVCALTCGLSCYKLTSLSTPPR